MCLNRLVDNFIPFQIRVTFNFWIELKAVAELLLAGAFDLGEESEFRFRLSLFYTVLWGNTGIVDG